MIRQTTSEGNELPVGTISTYKSGEKRIKTSSKEWKPYTGSKSSGGTPAKPTDSVPDSDGTKIKWSDDEKAVLRTYSGKKMSDKARLKQSGLSRDQFLRVSNDLRTKLANKGQPSWAVDLSQHAKDV
jgi:hypothetical protein